MSRAKPVRLLRHMLLSALLLAGVSSTASTHPGFGDDPQAGRFIDEMVQRHGFDRQWLTGLFAQAQRRDDILEAISRPAEKTKPWHEYREIFVNPGRIEGGVNFWQRNAAILARAEREFGVDPGVIVAIIGVETRYGGHTGRYRVLDALSTLAFAYPPRSKFFRSELEQFLLLAREEHVPPDKALGSYAGAMGYGQFIPSSYRNYAVDFDGDGRRDLWDSMDDIIGSVANYFHRHGWAANQPVARPARLRGEAPLALLDEGLKPKRTAGFFAERGITARPPLPADMPAALLALEASGGPEYWLTLNNFYVITRYNRSPMYAMAVYQLSEAIRDAYEQDEDI